MSAHGRLRRIGQDVAAPVVAEVEIDLEDRQVPIPFDLEFDATDLDPRGVYSVRATITGPDGELQWTTDIVNPIDPTQTDIDLGTIVLVHVDPSEDSSAGTNGTAPAESLPFDGEWDVVDIGGTPVLDDALATLVFDTDGNLGGTTGCNSWSTTYSSDDRTASIGSEIVTTLMARTGEFAALAGGFAGPWIHRVREDQFLGTRMDVVTDARRGRSGGGQPASSERRRSRRTRSDRSGSVRGRSS